MSKQSQHKSLQRVQTKAWGGVLTVLTLDHVCVWVHQQHHVHSLWTYTHIFSSGRVKPIKLNVSVLWNIRKHHSERKNVTAGVLDEMSPHCVHSKTQSCTLGWKWEFSQRRVAVRWEQRNHDSTMKPNTSFSFLPLSVLRPFSCSTQAAANGWSWTSY